MIEYKQTQIDTGAGGLFRISVKMNLLNDEIYKNCWCQHFLRKGKEGKLVT